MSDVIDLGEALDTVVSEVKTQFQTFNTMAAEDQIDADLPVPAILVQISEIEPNLDRDDSTGRLPCLVRLEAQLVLGARTTKVRREVAKAAGALAAFIYNNRLGVHWGPGMVISVEPDEFNPNSDRFDVWRVEWAHETELGQSYIIDEGVTPREVLTSWAPNVGAENKASYSDQVEGA